MLERFISFLGRIPENGEKREIDEARIAATALLVAVIDADGARHVAEMAELRAGLGESYGIAGGELDRLIAEGDAAERRSVDFHGFTRVLMRSLDEAGRTDFLERLWEIVYADGELNELEDNVVWRIAELLGIDGRDRIAIKRRVAAVAGLGGET